MNIQVKSIDINGTVSEHNNHICYLGIIKHLALAGQGFQPRLYKLMRSIGFFLHYSEYLNPNILNTNKFSKPREELYDPTEISQFSNLVGKAIADYLSKSIYGCNLTLNYEGVMKLVNPNLNFNKTRADLIAINLSNWKT